jgi:hypothetical protein
MPMITLTVPAGALAAEGRDGVQAEPARTLLRWEGAPDTAFFRAQAWSYLLELPEDAQVTAEDGQPRFLAEVTVPAGALSERRKNGLVRGRHQGDSGRSRIGPVRGSAGVGADP